MSAILYPVAANAETALAQPLGRAARARQATDLAGREVVFVTEEAGPAFDSYDAALAAWGDRVDVGKGGAVAPEDRFCTLREVILREPGRRSRPKASKPVFREGRRWSAAPPAFRTAWRLSVSYWRPVGVAEQAALDQARKLRRKAEARMDAATMRQLQGQPLRPVRPQQPLDIGLFEYRLPESPHIIVPDE